MKTLVFCLFVSTAACAGEQSPLGAAGGSATAVGDAAAGTIRIRNVTPVAAFKIAQSLAVTSSPAISITQHSATLKCSITTLGPGGNATITGFNYGLTASYGNTVQQSGSFGVGSFNLNVTGLTPGTLYHFRAFATSPDGTANSVEGTFITNFTDNPSGEVLFNGTQLGTTGSDLTGSLANMFDGTNATEWTTSVLNTWAGIDCGRATPLTRVRISPQGGYPDGGIGCQVQGSNDSTFAVGVSTLLTINTRLTVPSLSNEFAISAAGFRYYRVLASGVNWHLSDVEFIGTYTSGVTAQCITPVVSPPGGNYDLPIRVRISSITGGSHIFYTTDGSTPDASKTPYTGPFVVGATNTQVKVVAYATGLTPSRTATYTFIVPSRLYSHQGVYDNNNNKVTSFEGCYFLDPVSGYWYHYLMDLELPVRTTDNHWQGYRCYRSADFRNWVYRSNVLGPPAGRGLGYGVADFRLQMFYNSTTKKYVAWTDPDCNLHGSTGIKAWTSSSPEGPFTLAATYTQASPMADSFTGSAGTAYGDLGSFVDQDGKVYIAYNYNNNANTAFSQLDPANFTNTLGVGVNSASYANFGEAFSICRRGTTYFVVFSQLAGGNASLNQYKRASAPIGPWGTSANPFQAVSGVPTLPFGKGAPDNTIAYQGQTDQFVVIPGRGDDGTAGHAYIWVADSVPSPSCIDSSQLHIPVVFPTNSTMTITWQSDNSWFDGTAAGFWSLDSTFPNVNGAPLAAAGLSGSLSSGVANLTWTNKESGPYMLYLDRANDVNFTINVACEVLAPGTNSFADSVAPNNRTFYRVRTVNANGSSLSLPFQIGGGGDAPLKFIAPERNKCHAH
jgi:Chitobiase/beta-hexosaminidase C-terminal domain